MSASKRILVTRSSLPPFDEFVEEIRPLWDTHWITNMGEKHEALERALEEFLGVDNVVLFTNGHAALEGVFEAMRLGSDGRRKVITTPFTFASTTHALVRCGLEPVFADIRPDDYTIDPESVAALVDDETCAIVPVHVYGNLCDAEALRDIAAPHDLKIVYDAAHAFGIERDGKGVAPFGDASMFSFHATKAFNTIEGGAIAFSDPSLREALERCKNFGIAGPERVERVGGNAKMNEFCAAMGLCNLRHFDEEIGKRRLVSERYLGNLQGAQGLKLSEPPANVRANYAYMPVVFEEEEFGATRDDVFAALAENGIGARKYFFPLVSDFECYKGRFDSSATPVAQHVAQRVLALPMFADLPLEDVDLICDIVLMQAS